MSANASVKRKDYFFKTQILLWNDLLIDSTRDWLRGSMSNEHFVINLITELSLITL